MCFTLTIRSYGFIIKTIVATVGTTDLLSLVSLQTPNYSLKTY
jgi:hypothetical protein